MPASVKIVVLDTKLAIQSAFQALVENGAFSFINIPLEYHNQ